MGKLDEHDPLYPLENEEIESRKKLKKDRRKRKQGFKKKQRKKRVRTQRNKGRRRLPLHTEIQERLS